MDLEVMKQISASNHLQSAGRVLETFSTSTHVWRIDFFKPSGKWQYTDYVVMERPERWTAFDVLIQQALDSTPVEVRETTIGYIDSWTVVMLNNPLGFPIMVPAKEAR